MSIQVVLGLACLATLAVVIVATILLLAFQKRR